MFEYVGAKPIEITSEAPIIQLKKQDYRNRSLWKQLNLTVTPSAVSATSTGSSITAGGALSITAVSTNSIDATVVSMAVAVSGGLLGIGLSGAGAAAVNLVRANVTAAIDGAGTGISASSVLVDADGSASIDAFTGAAALAAALGGIAGGVSIAISTAYNEISGDVTATIANATNGVTATSGPVRVLAQSQGGTPVVLATGLTAAQLDDAAKADEGAGAGIDAAGDAVILAVLMVDLINAGAGSSGTPQLTALEPGSRWEFGTDEGDSYLIRWDGTTYLVSSPTISATSAAAALAVGLGLFGGAISGAGAVATNVVVGDTNATITDSSIVSSGTDSSVENAGGVIVRAADSREIRAKIIAVSLAVGGGAAGLGVAIGVAIAQNYIGSTADGVPSAAEIQATVVRSSVDATGALAITALSNQTIDALVVAASVAVAVGFVGFSVSGAGATTTNTIATDVKAAIDGSGPTGIRASGIAFVRTRHVRDHGLHGLGGGRHHARAERCRDRHFGRARPPTRSGTPSRLRSPTQGCR